MREEEEIIMKENYQTIYYAACDLSSPLSFTIKRKKKLGKLPVQIVQAGETGLNCLSRSPMCVILAFTQTSAGWGVSQPLSK